MPAASILVVEDDFATRSMLKLALELEGYQAIAAANGAEGLKHLHNHQPCLIFLDLMMPVMNGWEFLAALRQDPQHADTPVAIITAFGDREKPPEAQRVLSKPLSMDDLLGTARQYCG